MHLIIRTLIEGSELPQTKLDKTPMDEKGEYGEEISEGEFVYNPANFEDFASMDIETHEDPILIVCYMKIHGIEDKEHPIEKIPIPAIFDFGFQKYYVPNERDVYELV